MVKNAALFICGVFFFSFCFVTTTWGQQIVYSEHFTNGTASLNWFSAWDDSLGNPLTPMVPTNETGPSDDWIGVVTGDLETLGSLGAALAGDATLANYSMEAQVYIELSGGYYNGIMVRVDTTNKKVVGYQLVANFNAQIPKVRFRYFSQNRTEIRQIVDIAAADLPGGAPTTDGWHKMKIKAIDNQFWLYWDNQEITESPFTDPEETLSQGFFGVYVWDAISQVVPTTKVDDIIVRDETGTGIDFQKDILAGNPDQFVLFPNYPNPFNPGTNISYQINTPEHITVDIHDILGQRVVTFVSDYQTHGDYTVTWSGRDENGNMMPSGIYTYTLRTGKYVETKKMLMLK